MPITKELTLLAAALLGVGACAVLVNIVRRALKSGRIDSFGDGWAVAILWQGQDIKRSQNPFFFWLGVASYGFAALGCGALSAWIVAVAITGRMAPL